MPSVPAELSDALMRALDGAGIGISMTRVGADGALERVYGNQALADLLGVSRDDLTRLAPTASISPAARPPIDALHESGAAPTRLETLIRRPDGTDVPILVSMAHTTYRGDRLVVSFLENLTAQERMAAALRASEQRFRELVDASPDAITVTVGGRFVFCNRACAEMFGYASEAEVLAQPMSKLLPQAELATMAERLARLAAGERIGTREYQGLRKDGTEVWVEVSSIAIEHEGRPAILGMARDVGERRRLQARLLEADRMATVGTLAAGVAHEINNPLTYLLLHLGRLRKTLPQLVSYPAERDETARLLDEAIEGGERVRAIVGDLLQVSRSSQEGTEVVDVAQVLEAAMKLARTSIRHRAFIAPDFEAVPLIESSRARLGQVLLNLLVNAGHAFVDDAPERNRIDLTLRLVAGQVAIAVADNGPGIAEAHLPRIFEPFFTTRPGGTGLGLTITRSIVDSLGGEVRASNRAEGGSRFEVVLPLRPARPSSAAPPAPSVTAARHALVVVDDEERLAAALAAILEEHHAVETFTSSAAALERLSHGPLADLVLCDLLMPELSGMELHRALSERAPHYRDRFLFMTGGAFTARAAEFAASLTSDQVLHKPFDADQVLTQVAARLAARR